MRYNGVSSENVSKTVLQYEWSSDKTGKLKELGRKGDRGRIKIQGHYDAKKNVTRIEEKVKGSEDRDENKRKKILLGLAIVSLATENGKVVISY